MDISITGRNIELNEMVERYIQRRLGTLDRYFAGVEMVKVVVTEEKTKAAEDRFLVEATVGTNRGIVRAEERGELITTAVDKVKDVLKKKLERLKGKLYGARY